MGNQRMGRSTRLLKLCILEYIFGRTPVTENDAMIQMELERLLEKQNLQEKRQHLEYKIRKLVRLLGVSEEAVGRHS